MATAAQWWGVSASSENGKPFNVIAFQGTKAQAAAADSSGLAAGSGFPIGPYATQAAALAAIQKKTGKVADNAPGLSSPNPLSGLSAPLSGVDAIGAFFNSLGEASTWTRVAKVAIGGALVVIGIAHMTGASDAVSTIARKAPLPV